MSITEVTLIVGAVIAIISALWGGYIAIRKEARAQARSELRTEQAEATVIQLKAEIASKDREIARCTWECGVLRDQLRSCLEGS